ncbi:MAG TPA: NAD+ synthase [Phycisphaerales bacterium]|nr:NAD+ synthase [Phycisphaerales bacterium]
MRLAFAPINPTIGDLKGNTALIITGINRARDAGADVVVFPELALCGYPPRDLLLMEGFVPACAAAAKHIGEHHTHNITAIFGLPLPLDATPNQPRRAPTANALLAYRNNTLLDYYDKRLLPTYDVFDEDRYFEPGNRAVVIDLSTSDIRHPTFRAGLTICEDLWKGEDAGFSSRYTNTPDPVDELVKLGANLIISPSASPFVLGKGDRHRAILQHHATKHRVYVASVNQLGGNDDLLFDGHTLLYAPTGDLIAAGNLFQGDMLVIDLNALPGGVGVSSRESQSPSTRGTATAPTSHIRHPTSDISPHSSTPPLLHSSTESLLFLALTTGIKDYLRKTGFTRALLGLSGGIDSALTAALAVAALGAPNVLGVAMPSHYSSTHSVEDALDLASRLSIPCPVVPIEDPFTTFERTLNPTFQSLHQPALGEKLPDIAEENLQSRLRGTLLMALSNRTGAIVLTTGNKSELAVGYCTLYGDMNGGLAVLSDVTKQLVYRLSRWINANHLKCGFQEPPIPERTITKVPSAELRPNQTDQDSLPPYDILDAIIERHVERHQSADTIIKETGYDEPTVRRVLRLIALAEYKRKQAAIGLKVTTVAFGPGRRFPIAQRWT